MAKKIVIATQGSLGDLNPYIALALGLKARGHEPVILTNAIYQQKLLSLGIKSRAVSSNLVPTDQEIIRRVMDLKNGTERLFRDILFPHLRSDYQDFLNAVDGADLLISGSLAFVAPLVAEKTKIPWISTLVSPMGFWSSYDPPVPPPMPVLSYLHPLGPRVNGMMIRYAKFVTRNWADPIYQLRKELGLPRGPNPLFEGQHSPLCVLALFSRYFGSMQPDWPQQTQVTGFAFYDEAEDRIEMPRALTQFLEEGPPPVVFTLGTAAVLDAGNFYEESVKAIQLLGQRAVLLVGSDKRNIPKFIPKDVLVLDYVPYSKIFPRASVIVHQGGVGTSAQALSSGKPMLVMPYSHDQPDNAARLSRLGVARILYRKKYNARSAARKLESILKKPKFSQRAQSLSAIIRSENGTQTACSRIERFL